MAGPGVHYEPGRLVYHYQISVLKEDTKGDVLRLQIGSLNVRLSQAYALSLA